MAVVVRNESGSDKYFDVGTSKKKTLLAAGAQITLTEKELESIPMTMRGPGGLNVLYPDDTSSTSSKINLDYTTVFSTTQILYFGTNRQSALNSDSTWTIKYFQYIQGGDGTVKVSQVQILENVIWDNRASLPWT